MENFNWQDISIFDFSFTNFVTTKLIKLLYAITLGLIAIGFVVMVIVGIVSLFTDSIGTGIALICLSPFYAILAVLFARIYSEFVIVIFRIAENSSKLVEQHSAKEEQ